MMEDVIKYLVYVVMALGGYVLRSHAKRMDEVEKKVNRFQVDLAKNNQQNSELFNNIKRIDTNIDRLFDKMDQMFEEIKKR